MLERITEFGFMTTVQSIICQYCKTQNGVERILGDIIGGTCVWIKRKHTEMLTNTHSTVITGGDVQIICGYCRTIAAVSQPIRKEGYDEKANSLYFRYERVSWGSPAYGSQANRV